jgi:hypothetical protein
MSDDIRTWINHTPEAWPAEVERVHEIIGNSDRAEELLEFGFRPLGYLDEDPTATSGHNLDKPFEVTPDHLSDEDVLVDIYTGYRFRFLSEAGDLVFDLTGSNNYFDGQELLMLAAHRQKEIELEGYKQRTCLSLGSQEFYTAEPNHFHPLTLHVRSQSEFDDALLKLKTLFCKIGGARRLWFRGQKSAYRLERSPTLTKQFYGAPNQDSLLPSAGRFARGNPQKLGFGLAFAGPNHGWKKPFLIWMMRENEHWFVRDTRALEKLDQVLVDEDDVSFTRVLMALQLNSELAGLSDDIVWPDEADDLQQWFFAFMKKDQFAITLQQYGYVTSLLDVTEDIDVALYFSQAEFAGGRIQKQPPEAGRLIYVFAERRSGDFFRHGKDLFWGEEDWVRRLPPRLARQKAGFIRGSTSRTQNFYNNMIVAKIYLECDTLTTSLKDEDLFPTTDDDLLYKTLREARPALTGLY